MTSGAVQRIEQHKAGNIPAEVAVMPKGYKRTELGVIPEDWRVENLENVASYVSSGKTKLRTNYGTFPVYGSTGLIGQSSSYDYEGECILVARVGANAGKINLVSGNYGVTDNTIIIRVKNNCLLTYLWRNVQLKHLNQLVFGSGQPLITGTQIKALRLPLPPLPEQQAIAEALGDVDGWVAALDALIAKKRDLKTATMQQLLTGHTRLAGFSGKWEEKKLGDLGSTFGGLTGKTKADFGEGSGHYITFMNVMANVIIDCSAFEQVKILSTEYQNRVMRGDILFNGSSETPEEVAMCALLSAGQPPFVGPVFKLQSGVCIGMKEGAGA